MKNLCNSHFQLFPFLLLGIFAFSGTYGSVLGPYSPGTLTNIAISGSKTFWLNTSNISSSDNSYATINPNSLSSSGDYTDYLSATNFGFVIPDGATINGILVEIERGDINNAKDYAVRILKNGKICSNDYSKTPAWSTEEFITYGSATTLWGETWLTSDINLNNFGVAFACKKQGGGSNPSPFIDNIRISVYYSFTPLPITLTLFNAEQSNNNVLIRWETSSETNNSYFTLEKSIDGYYFSDIEMVYGGGTTTTALSYQVEDKNVHQGIIYYRLKQTDYDGKSKHSKIISIYFNPAYSNSLALDFVIFMPDLNKICIQIESSSESVIQITLLDNFGRQVFAGNYSILQGENKLDLHPSSFKTGTYHLVIQQKEEKIIKTLSILK